MQSTNAQPVFLPLIEAAKLNGIGRTTAFELARTGQIDTFLIGSRRYAVLESLRNLPERMKAQGGAA